MKKIICLGMLLAAGGAYGQTQYSQTFVENAAIPDGNPIGIVFAGNFNNDPNVSDLVQNLTFTLNMTGGYNGDLYAYLVSPDGTRVTLLDQPGVTGSNPAGYSGSGFNLTFADSGTQNIQDTPETSGVAFGSSGTYQADENLSAFNGLAVDGTWTLFFADLSSGGGTSELNSWTLNITTAPEPANVALVATGGLLAIAYRIKRQRSLSTKKQ